LRRAEPGDVDALLALVDDVVAWLDARGRSGQWGARPLSEDRGFRARTANAVAAGLVTVAVRDGAVVGAMVVDRTVPGYVPPGLVPSGALYVHSLVSARSAAGAGVGRLLVDRAMELAAGTAIALDHWSGSPELAALYEKVGFFTVGTFTLDQRGEPWPGTLRVLDPRPR
jgi:GNAT superfamily N-acetyltransferase